MLPRTRLPFFPTYRFLSGFVRYLRLKLTGRDVLVSGACRRCGACCREVNIEYRGRWIRSPRQFARLKEKRPAYARFRVTGIDEGGFCVFTCDWVTDEGLCRDHENRLAMCRNYPSKGLYYLGADTLDGCGYRFHAGVPFDKVLRRALRAKEGGKGTERRL
jgi:hypothetical protein